MPLPARYAADSVEALAADRYTRTPLVYLAVLASVAVGCASLPLIRVPVAVRAAGMIRPAIEKHEIRSPVAGVVAQVEMVEGQSVSAGEPLLRLATPALSARDSQVSVRRREISASIADLQVLSGTNLIVGHRAESPVSGRYSAELRAHRAAVAERLGRADRVRAELERADRLMFRGVIPAAEVERLEYDLAQEEAALTRLVTESRARWARDLADQQAHLRAVEEESAVLRADRSLAVVSAPMSGSLEDVRSLAPGGFVTSGERLATLSPRSRVRVEAHLAAREVALVQVGSRAVLRVEGYDPGAWGLLGGRVASVSDDYVVAGGQPMFRLVIELDRDHLIMPDGRIGPLRKGVPVEVRIVVAYPSVYRLLRSNIRDWLHPRAPDG